MHKAPRYHRAAVVPLPSAAHAWDASPTEMVAPIQFERRGAIDSELVLLVLRGRGVRGGCSCGLEGWAHGGRGITTEHRLGRTLRRPPSLHGKWRSSSRAERWCRVKLGGDEPTRCCRLGLD